MILGHVYRYRCFSGSGSQAGRASGDMVTPYIQYKRSNDSSKFSQSLGQSGRDRRFPCEFWKTWLRRSSNCLFAGSDVMEEVAYEEHVLALTSVNPDIAIAYYRDRWRHTGNDQKEADSVLQRTASLDL